MSQQPYTPGVIERFQFWRDDRPVFAVGDAVYYLGQRYEVMDVCTNHGEFFYYLNDGSAYPHCEDNLRRARA